MTKSQSDCPTCSAAPLLFPHAAQQKKSEKYRRGRRYIVVVPFLRFSCTFCAGCAARGKKCRKREHIAEENCNFNKATKKMAQKERWPLPHAHLTILQIFYIHI